MKILLKNNDKQTIKGTGQKKKEGIFRATQYQIFIYQQMGCNNFNHG